MWDRFTVDFRVVKHSTLRSFTAVLIGLVAGLLETSQALAADQLITPPQMFIVTANVAPVMAADKQIGTVPLGSVLQVSRKQGNWRFAREQKGWIHLRDLVPLQDAEEKFTKEITQSQNARSYQLRGIARLTNEQWARAAQDFEKAYDLGETSVSVHLNLGVCYEKMGELGAAIEEYDTVLKTYPDDVSAALARGNLLLQQGQFTASLRDFDQVISKLPQSADAHNSRGVALRMLGRFEEANAAYTKALEIDPTRADSLSNRGYAQKNLGDLKAALKDYEAAVTLAPDSNAIPNDLAWLLATAADESIRNGPRAVEISEAICKKTKNQDGEFLDTLAAAYACVGNYNAAVEAARLALTRLGKNPGAAKTQERLDLYLKNEPYIEPLAEQPSPAETSESKSTEPASTAPKPEAPAADASETSSPADAATSPETSAK